MNYRELLLHRRWLHQQATRMVRCPAAAEDLVQETYLAVMGQSLPEAAPARAWLCGVLRNLARMRVRSEVRRAKRETDSGLAGEISSAPTPDMLVERSRKEQRLTEAVERLPEPLRETLLLRYVEGYSSEEIARQCGVPAGTVRWRQKRALELLRESLEPAPAKGVRRAAAAVFLPIFILTRGAAAYVAKVAAGLLTTHKAAMVPLVAFALWFALTETSESNPQTAQAEVAYPASPKARRTPAGHPVAAVLPLSGPIGSRAALDTEEPALLAQQNAAIGPDEVRAALTGMIPTLFAGAPAVHELLLCAERLDFDPSCKAMVLTAIAEGQPICDGRERAFALTHLQALAGSQHLSSGSHTLLTSLSSSIMNKASSAQCSARLSSRQDRRGARSGASRREEPVESRIEEQPEVPEEPICSGAELHIVGLYTATMESRAGQATVRISRPGPAILVLSAYEQVHWNVIAEGGAVVERVILNGYHTQTATAPAGALVERQSYDDLGTFWSTSYTWQAASAQSCEQQESELYCEVLESAGIDWRTYSQPSLAAEAERMTGRRTTTFHGCYAMSELTILPHDDGSAPDSIPSNCGTAAGYGLDTYFARSVAAYMTRDQGGDEATCGMRLPNELPAPTEGPCAGKTELGLYHAQLGCGENPGHITTEGISCSDALANCQLNDAANESGMTCWFDGEVLLSTATCS